MSDTLLQSTSFASLPNWSVQYLLQNTFSYNDKYNLVHIGDFLTRDKTTITIEEDKTYKRVTIKINNGGVYLRDIEKGINIGTKNQFLVKEGQFLLSKIDARNGAFGVVPAEVDNAIITGNFWTFDVDYQKINPYFLSLMTTTPEFIIFCSNASNGTTNRHYLQEDLFLEQKIPLPTLEEQNRLIDNYNQKIEQAQQQEAQALALEQSIEEYLDKQLGIEKPEAKKTTCLLSTVSFKNLEKWGFHFQNNSKVIYSKNYEVLQIQKICSVGSGGTPSRTNREYYKGDIPWIKTGEVINDVITDTEEKITKEAIENSSARLFPEGSLIIAMYGQGKTRGRTAKLGIESSTNQACAVLFDINENIVLTDYLWVYLMNEYERLREMASGNNQPNLNAQMIKTYPLVIPPIDIQKQIVSYFLTQRKEIKLLREQAKKNRQNALSDFEKEIFKA